MGYPLFLGEDKLPYGLYLPGVDFMSSPIFEVAYFMEFLVTTLGVVLYIPFINMFISFVIFGITMIRILQRKFLAIADPFDESVDAAPNNELIQKRFRLCIELHKRIIRYVNTLNQIVSMAFLVEIIVFGVLLCVLLFFVQLVEKPSHRFLGIIFIFFVVFQLFSLYWLSNQLIEEVSLDEVP